MPLEKMQIDRPKNILPKPAAEKIELKTRKTPFSNTYINRDGTFTLEVSARQRNFKNRSGNWEDIDNTIVKSKVDGYDYENLANSITTRFARNNQNGKLVYIGIDESRWVEFSPIGRFTQLAAIKDKSIYYKGVKQGVDLEYELEGELVKENIIFNTYPESNSFTFNINYQGINLEKQIDGSILATDKETGENLFYFRQPYAVDANNIITDKVSMNIVRDAIQEQLVYIIDPTYLKTASYPVVLDPVVATIQYADAQSTIDTFLSYGQPTTSYSAYTNIHAGYIDTYYGTTKALIWFRYLPSLPPGAKINEAFMQLTMWQPSVGNSVNIYRITSPWTDSTTTWANPPAVDTSNPVISSFSSTPSSVWNMDISQTVKDWYSGTTPNYGFMLSPTNPNGPVVSFYSSNETNPLRKIPALNINYKIDGLGAEPYWGFHGNVNVYNGNLVISDVDVTLPGRGVPITITRTYNSRTYKPSIIGLNWTLNVSMRVDSLFSNDIVKFTDADGTIKVFTKGPNNVFRSPAGVNSTMFVENNVIVIKEVSGVKYYFTADGRLDKIVDTNDNTTDIRYLADGNIGSIIDPSGRTITFNYVSGKLESITGNEIPTVDYIYTGNKLTKVVLIDASSKVLSEVSYNYDANENLMSITDGEGNTTSYAYMYTSSASGLRVQKITKYLTIGGVVQTLETRFSYVENSDNTVFTTVTDPKGYNTIYKTDAMGRVSERIQYEDVGTETAPQIVERKNLYTWSEEQNLVGMVEPKWSNLPEAERALYETVVDYDNNLPTRHTDNQGYSIVYKYDVNNDPTQIVDFNNNSTVNKYDPDKRNMLMTTTPISSTISMDYDSNGNMVYQSDPIGLAGNLVQDSGFENIATGTLLDWNIFKGSAANVLLDTTQMVNGKQSMKLISKGNEDADRTIIISDYIKVIPNFKYNVSTYIKTSNVGYAFGGATIGVKWYKDINVSSTVLAELSQLTPTVSYTSTFVRKGARVMAPSDAQYARITLSVSGGTATTPAEAWFDNVQFEGQAVLNEQNLLYNDGFELDINKNNLPDGWWLSATTTSGDKLDTKYVRSGTRSFYMEGSIDNKLLSQTIRLEGAEGVSMHFSGWSRVVGSATAGGKYQLLLQFKLGDTVQSTYTKDFPIVTDGSWRYIESTGESIARFDNIVIYCKLENQPNLQVWFDDIKVRLNIAPNAVMNQYNIVQNGSFEFEQFATPDFDEWKIMKSTASTTGALSWTNADTITIGSTKKLILPFSGDRMFKMADTSDWILLVNNTMEPIKANTTYTVSAAVRTENVTGQGVLVKFDVLDSNGNYSGQKASKTISGTNDWTRLIQTITYDEAQTIAKAYNNNQSAIAKYIQVSVGTSGAMTGNIYIDAVRLSEGNELVKLEYENTGNYVNKITTQAGNSFTMLNDNRGNKLEITDAKSNKYTFTYDKADKVNTIEYPPISTNLGTQKLQTRYYYSKNQNLQQIDNHVFDSATNTFKYYNTTVYLEYNELGLPKSISDANWQPTYFDYDKNANVNKVRFLEGKYIDYTYDRLDRVKTEILGIDTTKWEYAYDENGNIKEIKKNNNSHSSYTYDTLNRMTSKIVSLSPAISNSENYKYNGNSQLTEASYPILAASPINQSAPQLKYAYDYAGNNTDITGPNGITAAFMIDEESRLKKSFAAGPGMHYVTYMDYDSGNRIAKMHTENMYGSRIVEYSYEYDANGNRTKEINNRTSKRVEYTYDSINQLVTESYFDDLITSTWSKRITYKYDIMGNRTNRIVEGTGAISTSYQYNQFNEVLSKNNSNVYAQDKNGNLITNEGATYVYNDKNQLIRVDENGATKAIYEYNWQGLRSKKITGGRTEYYYYTGNELTYITDGTNKVKYFFVRDTNGILLHMIDYTGATPAIYYYIRDAHGNIVALADSAGVRKVNYEYDAWGLLVNVPENNVYTGNGELLRDANPFRYSGYQFDPETELYYLKARYYSPYLGRFITEDPVISMNRYSYCLNNPVNSVDIYGLYDLSDNPDIIRINSGAIINKATGEIKDKSKGNNKVGTTGEPNTKVTTPNGKTVREYGPDGKAKTDTDYGHPHHHPELESPHHHDWDWENPAKPVRGPAYNKMQQIFLGLGIVVVAAVGIVWVVGNDISGIGVADDWALAPLGSGFIKGVSMIF